MYSSQGIYKLLLRFSNNIITIINITMINILKLNVGVEDI